MPAACSEPAEAGARSSPDLWPVATESDSSGGAVWVDLNRDHSLRVVSSTFRDNRAGQFGGAISAYDGYVSLSGCTFAANRDGFTQFPLQSTVTKTARV